METNIQHHPFSASSAEKWFECPGSLVMEEGIVETRSPYADKGSAAHFLGYTCFTTDTKPADHEGRYIVCGTLPNGFSVEWFSDDPTPEGAVEQSKWPVDFDMAASVNVYYDAVQDRKNDYIFFYETRVNFGDGIGVPGAFGTADVIGISRSGDKVIIIDFKNGRTFVDVRMNKQLLLYALGVLNDFQDFIDDLQGVNLMIVQPAINNVAHWRVLPDDLAEFQQQAIAAVKRVQEAKKTFESVKTLAADSPLRIEWEDTHLSPSEKACQWCKAKGNCAAYMRSVQFDIATVAPATDEDFEDLDAVLDNALEKLPSVPFNDLARFYSVIDKHKLLIEAVELRMLNELLAGAVHPDYKIVTGRQGNRRYTDEEAVERIMKLARFKTDDIYNKTLKSPAQLEKVLRNNPKHWKKIEPYISRAEGKMQVAKRTDKSTEDLNPFDHPKKLGYDRLKNDKDGFLNELLGEI